MEMIDINPVALYNYKKDKFHASNLIGKEPELQKQMEDKLKAIIQTYNSRMLDNNLTVKNK
jgi:hypothetical protein